MPREMPKFTKTPPEIVEAFVAAAPLRRDVERKTMFGYPALSVKGNMFAFTFGARRPMGEYVEVPAKDTKGAALKKWMADGLAYADTLPAKAKKEPSAQKKKPAAKRKPKK